MWRILRQFDLIDVTISPQGEKASLPFLFDQIKDDMSSKKFDLILAHTLVPHKPYGYNSQCNYVGKKSLVIIIIHLVLKNIPFIIISIERALLNL